MCVANLDHLDLGEDAIVEGELLALEADEHLLAQVDGQQVSQLLHGLNLPVEVFNLVSDIGRIRLVLKERGERLFALRDVLQVMLGFFLLLLEVTYSVLALVTLLDRVANGL